MRRSSADGHRDCSRGTKGRHGADVWRRPFEAALHRDFVRAADLFAELGYVDEGLMRLKAAEQLLETGRGGEIEGLLQSAVAFFRPLGATRYLHEAEALRSTAGERRSSVG